MAYAETSARDGMNLSRGATAVGRPSQFYPSPFFDMSRTYLPATIQETFEWCAYYYLTNPIVHGVVTKLSAYAVTDLVYDDTAEGRAIKKFYEQTARLRTFLVSHLLDRNTYGNGYVTVNFPFRKYLTCRACSYTSLISKVPNKFASASGQFSMHCPKCDRTDIANASDRTIQDINRIVLKRWSPSEITIDVNPITMAKRYYYKPSRATKNEIRLGRKHIVEATPQAFLEAACQDKLVEIDSAEIFHSARPTITRDAPADAGLGSPLIMPVLKEVWLRQILKKSQEVVAMEFVVPFRSVFPEVRAAGGDIYAQLNVQTWQKAVSDQIKQWKRDPGHIAVMPVPIGQQMLGGQGKGLMLFQELRSISDDIIAGMGVPTGFFYGEAMYSGANVNMRAMENEFLAVHQDLGHLVAFITHKIARVMGWATPSIQLKPFKMADDMTRQQFATNLAAQNNISKKTALGIAGFEYEKENEQIEKELEDLGKRQLKAAESQAAAQAVVQKAQMQMQQGAQAQQAPQQAAPPGAAPAQPAQAPQQSGPSPDQIAQALQAQPEPRRYQILAQLRAQRPELYAQVNALMQGGAAQQQSGPPVRELPEKLPPRAGAATRLI